MGVFRKTLERTRKSFFGRITNLLGAGEIDDETWEDIEALLVQGDVGVHTAAALTGRLRDRMMREGLTHEDELERALRAEMLEIVSNPRARLDLFGRPLSVLLIVGVNGSGKTTAIGKLAHKFKKAGRKVALAAGDTFRAAAIEQLQRWGERVEVPVIAGQPGGDPGALVFDALKAAQSRGYDLLIVDTAGRLHTKFNLMEELSKVSRVMQKVIPDAPHETLLVLDGTTGQNALIQARKFKEAVEITGVVVTKLDSTAKGGMIFPIYEELKLPVALVGVGEGVDDIEMFDPEGFVDALFER
ncbi:MAG: signal recognition particle-docking protein FtsY [Anaerolineae bacterium]|nr:signal recognition particle-docking protein FtsY [Anaerolineae bacterium]